MVSHRTIAIALAAVLGVQGGPCRPNSEVSSSVATLVSSSTASETVVTGISSSETATPDGTWLSSLPTSSAASTDSTVLDTSSMSTVESTNSTTTTTVSDAESSTSESQSITSVSESNSPAATGSTSSGTTLNSESTSTISETASSAVASSTSSDSIATASTQVTTSSASESTSSAIISTSSMTITEAPVVTNLVRNPSFEDDSFAPWSALYGEVKSADRLGVAQDKYKYFALSMSFSNTRDIRQAEVQGMEAGVPYKLTFYIAFGEIRASTQWSSCTIAIITSYGVQRHTIKPTTPGQYQLIENVFTPRSAPSGILLRHSCEGSTDVDLWLDNISVVKIDGPASNT